MAPPPCVTQQYHLVSMAAQLSSTGISHHIPSICLSVVNSSPHPGIAPHPWTPGPSHCTFQGTSLSVQDMYGCDKDYLILIQFRLSQISCFTVNLTCFISDSFALIWGSDPCLSSPTCWRQVQSYSHSYFFSLVPLSYQILHGSIYSILLVRHSCPLLAGVLHGLLCLKVYSWCIRGEIRTPRPPTPPPSCSQEYIF